MDHAMDRVKMDLVIFILFTMFSFFFSFLVFSSFELSPGMHGGIAIDLPIRGRLVKLAMWLGPTNSEEDDITKSLVLVIEKDSDR